MKDLNNKVRDISFLERELDKHNVVDSVWKDLIKKIKEYYLSIKHDPYTIPEEFKDEQSQKFDRDIIEKTYFEIQTRKSMLHLNDVSRYGMKPKKVFKKYKIKEFYKNGAEWWERNVYAIMYMYELISNKKPATKETFELELNKNIKYLFDAEQSGHSVVYHVQESIISLERILGKNGYAKKFTSE